MNTDDERPARCMNCGQLMDDNCHSDCEDCRIKSNFETAKEKQKPRRMKANDRCGCTPGKWHKIEHDETSLCTYAPACEPVKNPRRMKPNENLDPEICTENCHSGEHDETYYCGVAPACEPMEDEVKPERMKGNDRCNFPDGSRHRLEHDETPFCSKAPACEPVEDDEPVEDNKNYRAMWKVGQRLIKRVAELVGDVGYRDKRIAELEKENDALKATNKQLQSECEEIMQQKPRRMKGNTTMTYANEHTVEHDENPSCAIGIPCKPVEDDEPVENKNYRVMWKAEQMLIEIQDKKIVHLYERIDKMLIEHADAISHHNERIFEMVSKEKALVEAIHHQNSKAKTLSTTIVSLKDQHIESERKSVDTIVKFRYEIGELEGKVTRREKRIDILDKKIDFRNEQIAKLHSTAMNLIAETTVRVSSDTTACGYCNAFDNPGEGEVPDFLHMGYCPVGTLEKVIKEWKNE